MSKTDALRAIKDARRAAASTAPTKAAPPRAAPPKAGAATPAPPGAPPSEAADETSDGLCGHRSMNGRSCTRPDGHPEKNHRYG